MNECTKKRDHNGIYFFVEPGACEVTTVSAYDLLSDEDREALAWVREMGGVEAAKARTMPEGCEWPRFDTGEPVRVGDKLMTSDGAVRVEELSLTICDTDGGVTCVPFGERVKRPAVLAADGEPLEVGQTVLGIGRSQHEFEVLALNDVNPEFGDRFNVKCFDRDDDEECWCDPSLLAHQRPVPPDSWERIEEDALKDVEGYFSCRNRLCGECSIADGLGISSEHYGKLVACAYAMRTDIERRCRAVAERERGA